MAEQKRENDGGQVREFCPATGGNAHADALGYAEAIIATVREPLVVLNADLRVRTANRSFYNTFRVRPDETEGKLLYDLGNGQWDIPALRTLLGEILPSNTVFNDFQVEHDFPDIGRRVMLLNARKMYRESNHTELILLAIEDVTALREAERARREAETRFTEMVKNVRDHSIFLTDPDGVITSWNVAAERVIGYTEAEAVGQHFSLIFTPEDVAAGVPEQELRLAKEAGRAEDERWHRRKDGTLFWALGIVTPLHDAGGRLTGFSKILRDMTEWKRADEEARGRQRQLQVVTDHAPVLLAQVDADRRFRFVNVPYAWRFNLHPRDIIGRPVRDVLGQEAYARIEPHMDAALAGNRVEFEVEVPYDGEGTQTMRVAYEPERGDEGRVVGFVAAFLDISDRKQAEEELAANQRRLQALFDNTLDAVLLADDQARYVDANPAACTLLGYDREELLRRGVFDITPAPNGEAGRAAWIAFVRDGQQSGEYEVSRKDGTTAVVEYRAVANVQPGLHLSVLRDVSERRRTEEALRESRERLRAIIDNSPSVIFVKDLEGRYLLANQACEGYSGEPPERMLGKTDADFLPREYAERFRADDLRVLQTGDVIRYEEEAILRGQVVTALTVKFPLRDASGQPYAVCGIATDITELKKAGRALRESEERLRTLSNNLPHGAIYQVVADSQGGRRFLYISAGVERLFGVTPDEAMADAMALYGLIHEEDRTRLVAAEEAALRDKTLFDCEFRSRTRGGDLRWLHCRSAPRRLPSGDVVWEGVMLDATARKDAEAAVARSTAETERQRRLYETALSNTADFNYTFDLDGRFTYVNEALLALWGRPLHEAVGKNFFELDYPPDLAGRLQRQIRQVIDTRTPLRDETAYTSPAGTREYEYIFVPVVGAGGVVEAVAGSTRDITDRKKIEDQLRTSAERLREADRRKDEFLAMLAHELRNPLAPLRNAAQVIRLLGTTNPNVQRSSEMIERQVQTLTRLVDDLLDVSRITTGKIKLQKGSVELAAVVARAVETARPLIDARRHELMVTLPPEAVLLEADATRLAQVVGNLLTNAAKYTEDGGHIWLTAGKERGQAVLRVRDDGIGILPDVLTHVFDLFTQGDRALARSEGGLGIGLSLVRSLVEMHGGSVEAHSDGPARGSEFVVRLPVAATPHAPNAGNAEQSRDSPLARRRVLIVDDNADAAESLAMLLRLDGHEVRTAHDGPTALRVAEAFRPEVALIDIGLPGMDGYEVARRLRQEPGSPDAFLVALTGYGQQEDRRRSLEAGFDRHVVKPVDPTALRELLTGF